MPGHSREIDSKNVRKKGGGLKGLRKINKRMSEKE